MWDLQVIWKGGIRYKLYIFFIYTFLTHAILVGLKTRGLATSARGPKGGLLFSLVEHSVAPRGNCDRKGCHVCGHQSNKITYLDVDWHILRDDGPRSWAEAHQWIAETTQAEDGGRSDVGRICARAWKRILIGFSIWIIYKIKYVLLKLNIEVWKFHKEVLREF